MFDKKHKEHEINKLDKVYLTHVEMIKNESKEIQTKSDTLNSFLKRINDKIISVGSYKLEKCNELEELFDNLKNKLDNKVHIKLTKLIQCKNEISEKLKYLENIKFNVEKELAEAPKTELIHKCEDLINILKNINNDPETLEHKFFDNVNMNISSEIPSDIFPEYEYSIYEILEYKNLISNLNKNNEIVENNNLAKNKNSKEFIYSEELMTNGLVWRIKVYPNGNGAAKGEYISIFLELIEGLVETSKYYYKIELINFALIKGDKGFSNYSREFSSDFTNGECWGYNRFYKIENLESEGFIDSEKGKIMIKFYVRPQTYSQLCRDQRNYIYTIEKRIKYYINNKSAKKHLDLLVEKSLITNENKNEIKDNIRTSEEIAMNNFNMINNINNQFTNVVESNKVVNEENNFNIDIFTDNFIQQNNELVPNDNNEKCAENNLIALEQNVKLSNNEINVENNIEVQGIEEIKIETNPQNENGEVILTAFNTKNISKKVINFNTQNNQNPKLNYENTISLNIDKNFENFEQKFLLNNSIKNSLENFNSDKSFEDNLNLNLIQNNNFNFTKEKKKNLKENDNFVIGHTNNISISDEGSSFGSLMDSIKLIEETSFQGRKNKHLQRIEKENEIDFLDDIKKNNTCVSNPCQSESNAFPFSNYNTNNNLDKKLNEILKNEVEERTDKYNKLINNFYEENNYNKSTKISNYKKYLQNKVFNANSNMIDLGNNIGSSMNHNLSNCNYLNNEINLRKKNK